MVSPSLHFPEVKSSNLVKNKVGTCVFSIIKKKTPKEWKLFTFFKLYTKLNECASKEGS